MDTNLCNTLVQKALICQGTKLLAMIKKEGIGGTTSVKLTPLVIENIDGLGFPANIIITCLDPDSRMTIEIIPSQIVDVDGMVPERLGKIFNVNPDGTLRAPGKKRGRKPKK